ncbi:fimbrial protein [Caballeronia sp. GAWG1-1]|uniref:fimbrial protein n=1 Tax=Caballeronia sp. GAWG1-1 TaxID=2921742 RepID=UPI0020280088|nr:fimbrial protein [Caballeronia sp. GAWG1-1]
MNHVKRIVLTFARLAVCSVLAVTMLPNNAKADVSCRSNYTSFTITMPGTVAVPRDLANGSMLTSWSMMPNTTNMYTCTSTNLTYSGIDFELAGMSSTMTSYKASYNGTVFPVYQTNLPGVGIAMGGNLNAHGRTAGPVGFNDMGFHWNSNGTNDNGGQLIVALVKIGDITPGTLSGLIAQGFSWEGAVSPPAGDNPASGVISFNITPVVVTVLTCQTPDKTIPMGIHGPSDLPTVGSTSSNPASFTLDLNNCPGGAPVAGLSVGQINSIQYRIDPSNGAVAGFTNVAALSGSPSAGGVGIQLYDSTGAVFPLSVYKTLSNFNSATGGSYNIPLTARYYRTGTLTPGPANSTMTMTVLYQ